MALDSPQWTIGPFPQALEGRSEFRNQVASPQALDFLLVPDSGAARRLRRALASTGALSGVVVGTWPELLLRARSYYLPSTPQETEGEFEQALRDLDGAFWRESLDADPESTSAAVRRALIELVSASDPAHGIQRADGRCLSPRPRRSHQGLRRLAEALDHRLPGELAEIRDLLQVPPGDALYAIRVHRVQGVPHTTRWQDALIDKLQADAAATDPAEPDLAIPLREAVQGEPTADPETALGFLQHHLFSSQSVQRPTDPSVQWVRVRDFYQEAEVAAGMVQELLRSDSQLEAADIGLLVPDSFEYVVAVEDAFGLAGIPLAGLPKDRSHRDLGAEAVHAFLACRQSPAPAMAQAACLTSPLMPWSAMQGALLAQEVMGDRRTPALRNGSTARQRRMLQLIAGSDSEPDSLRRSVNEFSSLLDGNGTLRQHLATAADLAASIGRHLENAQTIDWALLRRIATPSALPGGGGAAFHLEGVTVWRERHQPWRDVRHLLVLGFSRGRYPAGIQVSPVFSEDDLLELRESCGLRLASHAEQTARSRQLLLRQLRAVSDSATFLWPHWDVSGNEQSPSDSLVFMQGLLTAASPSLGLASDLDSTSDRRRIRNLASAAPGLPHPPRDFRTREINLRRNLLELRTDKRGKPRPLSPSSLQVALVSPLAWVLRQVGAEPQQWSPETPTPLVNGTLAHSVFEHVFRAGEPVPDPARASRLARKAFAELTPAVAPFLTSPQWRIERRELARQVERAVRRWASSLQAAGARVLACEQWLRGHWQNVPVYGKCDLLLAFGRSRVLIVDYKWSKFAGHRERMERGWDVQLPVYRAMAAGGGLKRSASSGSASTGPLADLQRVQWVGTAYFTGLDQVCLSDESQPWLRGMRGWQKVAGPVDRNASRKLGARLLELGFGYVSLNVEGDRVHWEKECGIRPYAMDISPLVELFAIPEDWT